MSLRVIFSTLYRAGVPLIRALSIIKVGEPTSKLNQAVAEIKGDIQSGQSIADAMSNHCKVFPKVYTSAISAGEHTGKMDDVLDSLGGMLERDLAITRQIKSSTRYPMAVIGVIGLAFIALFTFVIPRFMEFYGKMGTELPLPTQILIGMNHIFSGYWPVLIGVTAAVLFTLKTVYSKPAGKLAIDTKILKIPIFGDLIIKANIARFSFIFQILVKSGIPVVKSLEMLTSVVKNARIAFEINIIADTFRAGQDVDVLLEKLVYFPEMALQMLKVGLESGSLDNMLTEVANHYSKEVDYKASQMTTLLEPIITIVLGGFILVVALAIFLPMWNLISLYK